MSNYTAWVVQYLHLPAPTGGPVVRENWETLWWTAAGDARDAIDTYDRLRAVGKGSYQFARDAGFVRLAKIELTGPGRGTVAAMGVPQVDGQICCLNCGTHSPLSLFPHRDGLGQVGGVLILCDRCRGRFAGQHLAISVTEPMPDCPPEKAGPPIEEPKDESGVIHAALNLWKVYCESGTIPDAYLVLNPAIIKLRAALVAAGAIADDP